MSLKFHQKSSIFEFLMGSHYNSNGTSEGIPQLDTAIEPTHPRTTHARAGIRDAFRGTKTPLHDNPPYWGTLPPPHLTRGQLRFRGRDVHFLGPYFGRSHQKNTTCEIGVFLLGWGEGYFRFILNEKCSILLKLKHTPLSLSLAYRTW